MKSKFLSLNWHDVAKGLLIAVLTPILVIVQSVLASGSFVFDLKALVAVGLSGFVAYLLKNFFEGDDQQQPPTISTAKAGTDDEEENVSLVGCRPNDR